MFAVCITATVLAVFPFVSVSVQAASPPTTMNFQGRLADSTGNIMPDGLYNMKFSIYSTSSGGAAIWTETRETTGRVQVTNGLFATQLGQVTPLSASLFNATDLYFEITMPTPATATCSTAACQTWETAMSRQKLATSAFAFNAAMLNGKTDTDFAAATGASGYVQNTTTPQTADFAITGTGRIDTTLQAPSIQRNTSGTLLVGTTATTTALTIGSTSLTGTLGIDSGAASTISIGTSASARTISIGNVAAVQTVTLGSTNTTSATTIQAGSGNLTLATAGTINLNSATMVSNATTANFLNTTSTTINAFGVATTITMGANSGTANIRNSNVTVGNATTRGTFTNNGATLNSTLALGDLAAGAIGTAAATVNIYTGVTISPTAAGRTYTVPSPTTTTAGRTFYISNINATNSFTVLGQTVAPNTMVTLVWGGAAWVISSSSSGGSSANTSLSNIASTDLSAPLNTTAGNLTLQTTTSGNVIINAAGNTDIQDAILNSVGNLTFTDDIDINTSANNAVNINTGTSTGLVTIGGGSGTFALNTTNIDISTAGAITGATGVSAGVTNTSDIGSSGLTWRSGYFGTAVYVPAIRPLTDSATALRLQNAAGTTTVLTVDTSSNLVVVGSTTNGISMGSSGLVLSGTARGNRTIMLAPEYAGATFTGSGTGNLYSDFCSGSGRLGVNTTACAASDEHNYYTWTSTAAGAQAYDIYIRYRIPSDFASGSLTNLYMFGWRGASASDLVELALFQANGAQCGTTTNVATGTSAWTETLMTGTLSSCTIAANDMVTLRVRMTSATNGNTVRAGEIRFDYKSAF